VKWAETEVDSTAANGSTVRCPAEVAAYAAACCLDQWDRYSVGDLMLLCCDARSSVILARPMRQVGHLRAVCYATTR
jgi:hypothetical protein